MLRPKAWQYQYGMLLELDINYIIISVAESLFLFFVSPHKFAARAWLWCGNKAAPHAITNKSKFFWPVDNWGKQNVYEDNFSNK